MNKLVKLMFLSAALLGVATTSCNKGPVEGEPTLYSVTFTDTANGSAVATPAEAEAGTQVTVTATAEENYSFAGWTVASGGITIPNTAKATFTMPAANVVLTPSFSLDVYSITVAAIQYGSVSVDPSGEAAVGATVTLTADPAYGYLLGEWNVTYGDYNIPVEVTPDADDELICTFPMPAGDVTIAATFSAIPKYAITLATVDGGMISASPIGRAEAGTRITLTAETAGRTWEFGGWTVTWGDNDTPLAVTPNSGNPLVGTFDMPAGDVTVDATFNRLPTYSISFSNTTIGGGNGGFPLLNPVGPYLAGDNVMVTAMENTNFEFVRWDVTGGTLNIADATAKSFSFHMPAENLTLQLTFRPVQ